jgi:nucleotide-binding universal stress UspA family protein
VTVSLVICCVDRSEAGNAVRIAGESTGAPLLLVHVNTSHWDQRVPAFTDDSDAERHVDHGPVGPRLLAVAEAYGAEMIVLGTRARRWKSTARYVTKRARCPVMIVGPAADPEGEAVTRPAFDRALLRRSPVPVVITPRAH